MFLNLTEILKKLVPLCKYKFILNADKLLQIIDHQIRDKVRSGQKKNSI